MHELSIVESMVTLALENANKAGAEKIVTIHLVVGELSGVVQEAVEFYFNFVSKDTIAFGATIDFKHIPTQLRCRACEETYFPGDNSYECPKCGEKQVDIIAGRELFIESLEVE